MEEFICPIIGEERHLPLYVIAIGYKDYQEHVIRNEGFPYHQIILCTQGEGILIINKQEYTISASQAFFLPKEIPHEYYKKTEKFHTDWIVFDGMEVEKVREALKFKDAGVFNVKDINILEDIFFKIFNDLKNSNFYSGFNCSSLLYTYIIEFNKQIISSKTKNEEIKSQQIQPILQYIEENYHKDITIEELSQIIDCSPQHLCHLFKESLNLRPFEFLAKVRITRAREILCNTDYSISEISDLLGYKDSSYFCAIFKRHEKISPVEFRKLYKKYF